MSKGRLSRAPLAPKRRKVPRTTTGAYLPAALSSWLHFTPDFRPHRLAYKISGASAKLNYELTAEEKALLDQMTLRQLKDGMMVS